MATRLLGKVSFPFTPITPSLMGVTGASRLSSSYMTLVNKENQF